jgi:tetratricopeptide (TPR) repeat protein
MHCYLRRNTLLLALLPVMAIALLCEPAQAFWRSRRARCCCNITTARTADVVDLSIQNPSAQEARIVAEIRRLTAKINRNPRDLEAMIDRAGAFAGLFYLGRNERFLSPAFKDLSSALRINPRSALAWEGLAYVYASRKDHAAALKALDRAISLDGKTFARSVNRGIAHWRLDQEEKALADYSDAIALNGNDAAVIRPARPGGADDSGTTLDGEPTLR